MAIYKDLRVRWEEDCDPELSWLGTYQVRQPQNEVYIDRHTGYMYAPGIEKPVLKDLPRYLDSRSMRYFTSCNYSEATTADEYQYFAADYKRMEDYNIGYWHMRFCQAVATVVFDSELGVRTEEEFSSGLGGIESDCSADYQQEIEAEQMNELREAFAKRGIKEQK